MPKKTKVGRPTIMTEETLGKLKEAYLLDCTDAEACAYAEINPSTLYLYQTENPEFIDKKAQWKLNPFFKIRKSVIAAAQSDGNIGIKYLERKLKSEFSQRQEVTGLDGTPFVLKIINYKDGDNSSV